MDLTFTTGLAIGAFVGWLVGMTIDYIFWRGNSVRMQLRDTEMSLATANQHLGALDSELNEATTSNLALNQAYSQANRELEALRAQLATLSIQESRSDTEASRSHHQEVKPSELEQVNGIDKVYAGKLREAGVDSFGQLVGLTPEDVLEIIQPGPGEFVDAAAWLAQARELAEEQQASLTKAFAAAAANVSASSTKTPGVSEFAAAAANVSTSDAANSFAAAAAEVASTRETTS
ncbi:MAG: helix-hairpin-helix domain-containing protein [Candidatus Promineifilaceae bacterium]